MKLQKTTWAGIALVLGTLAAVATGFAASAEAAPVFGTVATVLKYVLPTLGGFLVASDGGTPAP